MTEKIYINDGWTFAPSYTEDFLEGKKKAEYKSIRLPHTVKETPYSYFDPEIYQTVCGYRKVLNIPRQWEGKRIFLTVEAAAHKAEVFLNGKKLCEHACGYTAFKLELTPALRAQENILVIKLDTRETLDQPPFGKVIDYMTYGGLYREVYLEVTDDTFIEDVFLMPEISEDLSSYSGDIKEKKTKVSLKSLIKTEAPEGLPLYIKQKISPRKKGELSAGEKAASAADSSFMGLADCPRGEDGSFQTEFEIPEAYLWDVESPFLYTVTTELYELVPEENIDPGSKDIVCGWDAKEKGKGAKGKLFRLLDAKKTVTGFRTSVFKADGYYLNGRKLKLFGLDRHQSFPYTGYAMPASMQKMDADILKNELGLNAVRTSHYPCSPYFYERCDELGLLVFTEIPGWQNIGKEEWKDQAVENTKDMVLENRNHPCVILWGVRINESQDDDELYARTNEAAHALDPTRQTGGVRYIKKSHLLEDVYTYNDFSFNGKSLREGGRKKPQKGENTWKGCEPKSKVTSDMEKAYLISEYNGHMFPTKAFDCEDRRTEHALRHAAVLDSAAAEEDIAGTFGWCMFDYNTHKEFGSGDYICYHGVMDMYRNPKLAAAVYAAEGGKAPVLEISSSMDKGEHPEGLMGRVYIITNADEVRFYRNDTYIRSYTPADSEFKNMKHGPIEITDYVGDLVEKNEGFPKAQADGVKEILNYYARFGMNDLPKKLMAKAAWLMARYKMTMEEAYDLYGKYIGGWGSGSMAFKFEAVKDGKVVKTVIKEPVKSMSLRAYADHTLLREETSYDAAAVRIAAVDQNGNVLPFYGGSVRLKAQGPIEIIGPETVQLRGGYGGTYIKTDGIGFGKAALILEGEQMQKVKIDFETVV